MPFHTIKNEVMAIDAAVQVELEVVVRAPRVDQKLTVDVEFDHRRHGGVDADADVDVDAVVVDPDETAGADVDAIRASGNS